MTGLRNILMAGAATLMLATVPAAADSLRTIPRFPHPGHHIAVADPDCGPTSCGRIQHRALPHNSKSAIDNWQSHGQRHGLEQHHTNELEEFDRTNRRVHSPLTVERKRHG